MKNNKWKKYRLKKQASRAVKGKEWGRRRRKRRRRAITISKKHTWRPGRKQLGQTAVDRYISFDKNYYWLFKNRAFNFLLKVATDMSGENPSKSRTSLYSCGIFLKNLSLPNLFLKLGMWIFFRLLVLCPWIVFLSLIFEQR